jgi:hypothetical protein
VVTTGFQGASGETGNRNSVSRFFFGQKAFHHTEQTPIRRNPMLYEVLIAVTIAMVLLPFNFWFAAQVVVLVGLPTILFELQRHNSIG